MVELDGCGKCHLCRDWIPGPSNPKRISIPTELCRMQTNENLTYGGPPNDNSWFVELETVPFSLYDR